MTQLVSVGRSIHDLRFEFRVPLAGREMALTLASFRKETEANSISSITIRGPVGGSISVPELLMVLD